MGRFITDTLSGILGGRSATLYRLDPTGRVPVAKLGEVYGRFNKNKITADMISSENSETRTDASEYPIEDYADAVIGTIRRPQTLSLGLVFSSSLPIPLVGGGGGSALATAAQTIYGDDGARPDLIQVASLRAMQQRGEPVALLTPRHSMSRVMIVSVSSSWAPGQGERINVGLQVREARILDGASLADEGPDVGSLEAGNFGQSSAGFQGSTTSTATASNGGTLAAPVVGA